MRKIFAATVMAAVALSTPAFAADHAQHGQKPQPKASGMPAHQHPHGSDAHASPMPGHKPAAGHQPGQGHHQGHGQKPAASPKPAAH